MLDVLSQVGPVSLTASGLLALTVLMILTGRLVPRSVLDDTRRDRDEWRKVAETGQATNTEQGTQLTTVTELLRTHEHVLRSIQAGDREVQP